MPLEDAWVSAVTDLGGDATLAQESARDLAARYSEAHRRYHRSSHVEAVLSDADHLADAADLGPRERAILAIAVCAHDVVYDAKPGDDETASAEWARGSLSAAGIDSETIEIVAALILTTLTHSFEAGDVLAAVLSDADLAILGADEMTYDGYSAAVREEFASIPDDLWAIGRRHVLEQLLAKPRLFVTEAGFAVWEARARENVARELQTI